MAAKTKATPSRRPPRKVTTHRILWRGITCRVRHTCNCYVDGTDHVEIDVILPNGAPLPITDTGYRSHFLPGDELAAAGGPVVFVTTWLDTAARAKDWQARESLWRQGDLFAEPDPTPPVVALQPSGVAITRRRKTTAPAG